VKLVFFGSSDFSIPILERVLKSEHQVLAVVTKSDKPAGRGLKESPTSVKIFVQKFFPSYKLIQPAGLREQNFLSEIAELKAELFLVASFPIMPKELVDLPLRGCLNVHPSLLPKYRGAAPIRWTLLNGEKKTGVSTFFIGGKIDSGNILLQREIEIYPDEDYASLHQRLSQLGAELAVSSLRQIAEGEFATFPQDESSATPAPKIKSEHLKIDWSRSAEAIYNQIRAFSPEPGAYTHLEGKRLKILKAQLDFSRTLPPGQAICDKNELFVGCGQGALILCQLQMEGKKCLPAETFICGWRKKSMIFNAGKS
jgi:methionyl-tRNA formyltransferase